MNRKVIETIQKYHMLDPCDFVVTGVSGGADSLALLHFLRFGPHGLHLRLLACHVNHKLRGAESLRDQQHVEAVCRDWDVPLHVAETDVAALAAQTGLSLEETGRRERYRIFAALAEADGKIATAHTLSDSYETMLLNLTRGTGLKGLCGIPPMRGNVIRPLLGVTRKEVEEYCHRWQISYITDSTNNSTIYSRNKIRLEIIPRLAEINSNAVTQAAHTMQLLAEDSALLERLAAENLAQCRAQGGLCVKKLSAEPALRGRVLRMWLKENGTEADFDTIGRLQALVQTGGRLNVKGNLFCTVQGGLLRMEQKTVRQPYFALSPEEGKVVRMPSGAACSLFRTNRDGFRRIQEIFKNSTYKYIDCEKITGKLLIRQRQSGDKICLFPRNNTKSIKKLFNEAKISQELREKLFLISDERGIIYVENFGVDQRVAPGPETSSYLVIGLHQAADTAFCGDGERKDSKHGAGYFEDSHQ